MPFITELLEEFNTAISKDNAHKDEYERLFFAELFLHYAKNHKGDTALDILTDENVANDLLVPKYIEEGLEWLLK